MDMALGLSLTKSFVIHVTLDKSTLLSEFQVPLLCLLNDYYIEDSDRDGYIISLLYLLYTVLQYMNLLTVLCSFIQLFQICHQ